MERTCAILIRTNLTVWSGQPYRYRGLAVPFKRNMHPKQVQRYIKITDLIPEMLEKVDDGSMGFTPAVQLSYLNKKEQKEMLEAMEFAQCTPSLSQALRIKKLSTEGSDMEELQDMRTRKEQYRVSKDPALQKTMSVPEMRKLLGLKKTESYWLVHRNFFKTEIIGGVMRIDIESFEKWYANQVKHKKVNGDPPGKELTKTSYSFQEAANLLGVNNANLYEIWKREKRKTITVDFVMRIPKEEFEKWYEQQYVYKKADKMPNVIKLR